MEDLGTFWIVLIAIIGGITTIWKFFGTVKEIKKSVTEPITKLDAKVTDLKIFVEENDKLQNESIQSMLRDRLLQSYYDCQKQGFASISQKDNWENMYIKYHKLGSNGVMDSIHEKMMALPEDEKPQSKKKQIINE